MLLATGSEVELAVEVAALLNDEGFGVRVVSLPCVELFRQQSDEYRESVLPSGCRARVAIEAGHSDYWYRFVGLDGAVVGIDRFGVSAPGAQAMEVLGISSENLLSVARRVLGSSQNAA